MSRHTSKGRIFLTEGTNYDDLSCKGDVRAEGRISATSINIKGRLKADNDITAESSFNFKGKISAGNITAHDVRIISSSGRAGNITGSNIEIHCEMTHVDREELLGIVGRILRVFRIDDSFLRDIPEDSRRENDAAFTCREISGGDVSLFGVTCSAVSGRNVSLAGNCRVDRVAYSGTYSADDSCTVGTAEKV